MSSWTRRVAGRSGSTAVPIDVVLGHLNHVVQSLLESHGVTDAADTEAIDEQTPGALKQAYEVRVWLVLLLLHLSLTWGRLYRRGTNRTGRGPENPRSLRVPPNPPT